MVPSFGVARLIRKTGRMGMVALARLAGALLPGKAVVILKENISLVRAMDYAPETIWLNIESSREYRARLPSCAREPETVQWIEGFLQQGEVLFDIGANVGAYSLVAAKASQGTARIYAFEPAFTNFSQLCRNILLNGCADSIVPLPVALSDKTGLDCFNYNNLSAGGSLHTLGVPVDFKGDSFTPVFRHLALSYRLDDFIRDFQIPLPNHIKIDVDGTEAAVLRGAKETLASPLLRSLLVEAMPGTDETKELLDTLEGNGFSVDSKHDRLFIDVSGRSMEVYNYIFVRRR